MSTIPHPAAPQRPAADPSILVVVADGAALDRAGLAALLRTEQDLLVVGEAASTDEAIELCRRLDPHVLLLTLTLPGETSAPALPAIRAALPELAIVAMSDRVSGDCVMVTPAAAGRAEVLRPSFCGHGHDCLRLAIAQGAAGTVRRHAAPAELFGAIRTVAAGGTSHACPADAGSPLAHESEQVLSPRLIEVSNLLAEGRSNKEIASALCISEPTVKKHVTRLLDRLGLDDRLQAGLFVARNPLLFLPRAVSPAA